MPQKPDEDTDKWKIRGQKMNIETEVDLERRGARMGNYERDFIEKMRAEIQIPDLVDDKLNDIYRKIRQDEVEMKQTGFRERRNKVYRSVAVAVASVCMVAALSGIFYANPALARDIPILGDVFGRLQEIRENSEYPDKDKTAYQNISEHSAPVQEAGNSAENEIGTMTVSDAYCDGYDLYFTLSLRIEDDELKAADYLQPMHLEGEDETLYEGGKFAIDQKRAWPSDISALRKAEDGVYVGLCRIASMNQEEASFTDQMTVSIDINGLTVRKENMAENEKLQQVKGDWKLQFDVQTDTSANREAKPNAQSNGIIVQKAVQTPSNMHVTCYVPAELAENNPAFVLLDGDGNRVQNESAMYNMKEDGSLVLEMVFDTSQADQFVMQVFGKNAGIGENGDVPLIAEIPFSMAG